jgi:predicted nucleic acid-binding protein
LSAVVVDSSVLVKCFLPGEALEEQALQLLRRFTDGETQVVVPDLFWPEFGNVLWKAARQGRCTHASAIASISAMQMHNLPTFPSYDLIHNAFAIAAQFKRSVYDSVYVALAMSLQTHLVTADERLANAVAAYLPVKWLGAT